MDVTNTNDKEAIRDMDAYIEQVETLTEELEDIKMKRAELEHDEQRVWYGRHQLLQAHAIQDFAQQVADDHEIPLQDAIDYLNAFLNR